MKKIIVILLITLLALVGCNSNNENELVNNMGDNNIPNKEMNNEEGNNTPEEDTVEETTVFTEESLSLYNGEDGNPAYVAVDGIVYDVTDVKAWQSPHGSGLTPGKDYSEEITKSPHGKKNLEGLPIVGVFE